MGGFMRIQPRCVGRVETKHRNVPFDVGTVLPHRIPIGAGFDLGNLDFDTHLDQRVGNDFAN